MLIHQVHNSLNSQMFNIWLYRGDSFETHLHRGFELIYLLEGTLSVVIHDQAYELHADECALVMPYQLHSFDGTNALFCVVVFSGAEAESFAQRMEKKKAERPVFALPKETREYIKLAFLGETRDTQKAICIQKPDLLTAKGALYATLAEFMKQCPLIERTEKEQSWILQALFYVEEHFDSELTLADMAKELGYHYEYLSREFNRVLGISFKTLVNQYRCERARHLIVTTNEPITEIAMRSGFQSVRSFNRVFKDEMGLLPSALRRKG